MSRITVIGAGPLGRVTIAELTRQGHDVTVASRSRVTLPAATWVPVDVASGKGLDQLPASEAIVVCFGPPYAIAAWQRIWPVAIDNLIGAAQANDATLVLTGNLYAYARDRMPMRATDPLRPSTALGEVRAEVTRRLFAAHEQGRIRAVEVRGSDYLGQTHPTPTWDDALSPLCSPARQPASSATPMPTTPGPRSRISGGSWRAAPPTRKWLAGPGTFPAPLRSASVTWLPGPCGSRASTPSPGSGRSRPRWSPSWAISRRSCGPSPRWPTSGTSRTSWTTSTLESCCARTTPNWTTP